MSSKVRVQFFAIVVFSALIAVSVWATSHQSIVPAIQDLWAEPARGNNPWFWATLFDAYFAFLWFWCWVAWRENHALPRLIWLVLILALGNMAMAAYVLLALHRLPKDGGLDGLFRKSQQN